MQAKNETFCPLPSHLPASKKKAALRGRLFNHLQWLSGLARSPGPELLTRALPAMQGTRVNLGAGTLQVGVMLNAIDLRLVAQLFAETVGWPDFE